MRFSRDILELFAAASRDFSPLHMSDAYARSTPFGERVLHGACAVMACCAECTPPPNCYCSGVKVVFGKPVFLDIEYRVQVSWLSEHRVRLSLMDGSAQTTETILEFTSGAPASATFPAQVVAPLSSARVLGESDLAKGWKSDGEYSPAAEQYASLLERLGIQRYLWGDGLFAMLMASSYLTGMEMPGERAMYFQLQAELKNEPIAFPTAFTLSVTKFSEKLGMVKSQFHLASIDSQEWAGGEIQAFLRPLPTGIKPLSEPIDPSTAERLQNRVVMVVGASRGLGAHLALTFAAAGAKVVGLYARSSDDAEKLKAAAAGLPGRIDLLQCDAADPAACETARERILKTHGRVDWLVCSAAPLPLAIRVEPEAFGRINEFVSQGLRLVLAPLTSFLGSLAESNGSVLLISSVVAEEPTSIWPQYVSLKCAVEGLVRVAAMQYPKVSFCIARPDKLLTDMINTPMGRVKAENPASAAQRIVAEAVQTAKPGAVAYVK